MQNYDCLIHHGTVFVKKKQFHGQQHWPAVLVSAFSNHQPIQPVAVQHAVALKTERTVWNKSKIERPWKKTIRTIVLLSCWCFCDKHRASKFWIVSSWQCMTSCCSIKSLCIDEMVSAVSCSLRGTHSHPFSFKMKHTNKNTSSNHRPVKFHWFHCSGAAKVLCIQVMSNPPFLPIFQWRKLMPRSGTAWCPVVRDQCNLCKTNTGSGVTYTTTVWLSRHWSHQLQANVGRCFSLHTTLFDKRCDTNDVVPQNHWHRSTIVLLYLLNHFATKNRWAFESDLQKYIGWGWHFILWTNK